LAVGRRVQRPERTTRLCSENRTTKEKTKRAQTRKAVVPGPLECDRAPGSDARGAGAAASAALDEAEAVAAPAAGELK
jgi:hypothetical protein